MRECGEIIDAEIHAAAEYFGDAGLGTMQALGQVALGNVSLKHFFTDSE